MSFKILIVDDSPEVLALAEQMLKHVRPEWIVETMIDPLEAKERVQNDCFDAVVSDLEMPGLTGAEFLREVSQAQPLSIRFMVSSESEAGSKLEGAGVSHRFFAKPCDYSKIAEALERSFILQQRLRSARLRKLLTKMTRLPSPPETYLAIQQLLLKKGFHSQELIHLLKKELSLATGMLKVANSSYYGARGKIDSLERAVNLLGVTTIKALALGTELFARIDPEKAKTFGVERLFEHSTRVATTAATLAEKRVETKGMRDLAYTAGLLHDVGKLVLIQVIPHEYRLVTERVGREFPSLYESEISAFGVSHQEVGAYVLSLWGLPETIVEAVAYHHQPLLSPTREISVLTFVTAANMIDHGLPDAIPVDGASEVQEYLNGLGMPRDELLT